MVSRTHVGFRADDRSYFALLKKEIHAMAVDAGFSNKKVAEIDLVIAEMTSNLVKHASGGSIWVKLIEEAGMQGLELIAVDNGPGMQDVTRMVADGISTKNTLGHGLGSIKRLSDLFQIFSQKGSGTIVLSRIFASELPAFYSPKAEIRSLLLPKPGEKACGDGFASTVSHTHYRFFLGDGLGHGPEAEAAVVKACDAFVHCTETNPVDILRHINSAVKKTRGLVGTVVVFDIENKLWQLCGIGNISTRIIGPSNAKSYTAYNGIIGLNVPNTLSHQEVPYEKGQCLIMCSDGLKSRWDIQKYPGIMRYDPAILTALLVKEFTRNTDDMAAVACKINL